MLEGSICSLLPVEEEDGEALRGWRRKPHVARFFPSFDPISKLDQKEWMTSIQRKSDRIDFMIADNQGTKIGHIFLVSIDRRNRHAEFGFYIGESSSLNSGIGIEAEHLILDYSFNYLNMHKVYCETLSFNKRVLSLHKKFGFREDGKLRDHIYKDGQYHDLVIMSIMRDDFRENSVKIIDVVKRMTIT